jgi:LysR family transcriptional regulator, regulator for genes of the gallate degradation pathway
MATSPRPPARRPTLRRLAIFDAAARLGSAGAAAQDMGLTQPAVTHALGKLEDEVGERLLDRGAGGSSPTEAGRILHRRTARMLRRIEASLVALGLPQPWAAGRTRKLTDAQVRCHLAIAEAGSFRLAAAGLALAEPTLNRAARSLEAAVEVPLYQRRPRGLSASESGLKLAAELRLALLEIDQGLDELRAMRGLADGRLSLGCLPLMPKGVLARVVGELLRAFPHAAISLEEGPHAFLMEGLTTGRVDMVIGALQTRRPPAGLRQKRLFPDPYVVVASADHPLAGAGEPSGADLARQRWIIPWRDTPRRRVLEALFAGLPEPPRIVMETSSFGMMGAMLAESASLTVLSASQLQEDRAALDAVILPVQLAWPDRTVGLVYRSGWLPTRLQKAFLAIVSRQRS